MLCEFYEIVHGHNPLRRTCWPMSNGIMSVPSGAERVSLYFADGSRVHFEIKGHNLMSLKDGSTRWWHQLRPDDQYNPKLLGRISKSEEQKKQHGNSSLALFRMLYDMMVFKLERKLDSNEHAHSATYDVLRAYFLNEHDRYVNRDKLWIEQVLEEGWDRTRGVFLNLT